LLTPQHERSETPLLRLASSLGNETSTGLDVLLQQGFEQFRIWNGLEPPTELCREKVVEEYEGENPV
jgi:shikimate 5-dehydrogenase